MNNILNNIARTSRTFVNRTDVSKIAAVAAALVASLVAGSGMLTATPAQAYWVYPAPVFVPAQMVWDAYLSVWVVVVPAHRVQPPPYWMQ